MSGSSNTNAKFSIYDTFTSRPFGGNQACVVSGIHLTGGQLLTLAAEFLLPETVVREGDGPVLRLRYATSHKIIHRCGHATLAAIADYCLTLLPRVRALRGSYIVQGKEAEWEASIVDEKTVDVAIAWPEQPRFKCTLSVKLVAEAVALDSRDIVQSLPLCIYDSGNLNGLLPVKSESALFKAAAQHEKLQRLFDLHGLTDLHLYHLAKEPIPKRLLRMRCRNFFPYGVQEEAATGSASIALASALIDFWGPKNSPSLFKFLQQAKHRRGNISVRLRRGPKGLLELWLHGRVCCIVEGQLRRVPRP